MHGLFAGCECQGLRVQVMLRIVLERVGGVHKIIKWTDIGKARCRSCIFHLAPAVNVFQGIEGGVPSALFVPDSQISQFLVGVRPDTRIDLEIK